MNILDSSAMIAYLKHEPGGEVVRQMVVDGEELCAHAVNLCEVFYEFLRSNPVQRAELALQALSNDGVVERNDMDGAFWRDIGLLIHTRRTQPPDPHNPRSAQRLALGDAVGLALARRVGGTFVTADRTEVAPLQAAGLVQTHFIR